MKETVVPCIDGKKRPTTIDSLIDEMLTLIDQVLIDVFFTSELAK